MKIMSYEIPIYCWQLKRPGTGATRNFRVPLYLVTNLFWVVGGCRLGLGGSLSPSVSRGDLEGSQAPEYEDRHLDIPSEKGSASCPEKISKSKQNVGSAKMSRQKQRKGLLFLSLPFHTMKRLPKKISKILSALGIWCWDSLKYFPSFTLLFLSSFLSVSLF